MDLDADDGGGSKSKGVARDKVPEEEKQPEKPAKNEETGSAPAKPAKIKKKLPPPPRQRSGKRRSRERTPLASSSEDEEWEDEEDTDKLSTPSSRSPSPISTRRRKSPFTLPSFQYHTTSVVDTVSTAVVNIFTLACGVTIFGCFLLGSYDFFRNVENNKCEMTWMYNRPYYVPIKLTTNAQDTNQETYPMYKLYAYAEGEQLMEDMSRENYRFSGIPVLFIPGNAGSHQQVRSLASVALWKYLDAGTPFHFDFFTVDLNEEFSGLYGYTLRRQVDFVRQAVNRIVNLYEEYHRVLLVGHSMGGIIAKAVAMDQSTEEGSALSNLILTLATPHVNPVAMLDPEQDIFYYALKRNWTRFPEISSNISVVSIAGGERDYLVFSKLTRWPQAIQTISSGIPGVWASTDHLCIAWCKQLVLTTIRSLFDLVEFNQRNKYYAITENLETRRNVLNYHFKKRLGGKSYYGNGVTKQNQNQITLPKNVEQTEVSSGMHCLSRSQRPRYVLYSRQFLLQNTTLGVDDLLEKSRLEDYSVLVLTTNTREKTWILGCLEVGTNGQCTKAETLVQFGKILPHLRRRRKTANIPLSLVATKYTHLLVKMDSYPFKTCVMLETYNIGERTRTLGGTFQASQKIFYNLTFAPTGFSSYLAAWRVRAVPSNMSCPESHNLLAQFSHGQFEQSRYLKNESLLVRFIDWNVSSSGVELYLEPTCDYTVSTTLAPLETAGQFFRVVVRLIPSFYAAVVLMSLYFQKDPVEWRSFHVILLSNAYHLSLLPGFCASVLLHFVPTDWPLMMEPSEFNVLIPICCFMIAYCLVLSVSSGTWYAIITGGTALHSVFVRLLSTRFGNWVPRLFSNHRGFTSITEHVTEAAFEMTLTRFPLTISLILLAVCFSTCGSLGIALALVLYLIKLFKIYEDLLEDLLKAKIGNVTDSLSPMNFHFSCYMLWLILTVLNLPSLLHWSRTFSTEPTPQWDLSMYLCLLLLPTVAILWQDFVPKMEPTIWKLHRYVFYAMGMVCILWGTHRLYVTAFIITFVFLTMAVCQLVSVMMSYIYRNADNPTNPNPTTASSSTPASASSQEPTPPQPSTSSSNTSTVK